MRILVVNDDGIKALGIRRLARMAAGPGEVWVAAPAAQCSAMFQRKGEYLSAELMIFINASDRYSLFCINWVKF